MRHVCDQCSEGFEITERDMEYYDRVSPIFAGKKESIPPLSSCPPCRERQRMSFRNEWSFYRRPCDLTGKQMLTIYSPDKPYTVYEQSVWWSDQFDPLTYGRDFDFSRPFFEQWQELSLAVPRASIHNAKSENSEYTNYSSENKNCYLAIGSSFNEDTLYSYRASHCRNICDCYDPYECELCYECIFCKKLYNCAHCIQCHNSSNLTLCTDCLGCTDCFGCVNLRNKKFHIYNEEYDETTYKSKVRELNENLVDARAAYEQLCLTLPRRSVDALNCESSTGDHMINCKDCHDVFVMKDSEGSQYCAFCEGNTHCMDANFSNIGELQFHSTNLVKNYHVLFANHAWYDTECIYVTSCFHSNHLFGCISMKKNEYCILNKQYTKEEYETLVPQIIEHMCKTGEWGKYFPVQYSPFGFNETAGNVEHPLNRDTAIERGWKWYDGDMNRGPADKTFAIPRSISEVSDGISEEVLTCEITGKPYRITSQELAFYRRMNIPVPRRCPDQRQRDRAALRNPHKLWKRSCAQCDREMCTTFAPDRPEIVYCEECHLKEVY